MKNKLSIPVLSILFVLSSCAGNRKSISSFGGSFGENPVLAEKTIQNSTYESHSVVSENKIIETTAESALPSAVENSQPLQQISTHSSNDAVSTPYSVKEDSKPVKNSKIELLHKKAKDGSGKSQIIALVLVLLLGALGIHRFYLGYIGIGIFQLLTVGGFGIWALIDLIRIITGGLKPKDGEYDETF